MSARAQRCALCNKMGYDMHYCGWCRKSFCENCRTRYGDRVEAMMHEKVETIEDGLQKAWNFITGK